MFRRCCALLRGRDTDASGQQSRAHNAADAGIDEGIDTIHVWAIPLAGGAPQFLGVATLGLARPDVAALFGKPNVAHAGFHLDAPALPAGPYVVAVFGHSRISGTFNVVRSFTLVVVP